MKTICIFIFVLLFSLFSLSQSELHSKNRTALNKYKKAQAKYENKSIDEALILLNEAIRRDSTFFDAFILKYRIGTLKNDTLLQVDALSTLVRLSPSFAPNSLFILADYYFSLSNYKKALELYSDFLKYCSVDNNRIPIAKKRIVNCSFAIDAINASMDVNISSMSIINSKYNDYWPFINIYTKEIFLTRINGVEGSHDENILGYNISDSLFFDVPVNTFFNEGTPSITADGKFLYFSSNHPNGLGSHDIYVIRRDENGWGEPINLGEPINTMNWESQTSISADGKTLYFASNRPGGKGGSDIYRANLLRWTTDGFPVFSTPVNLSINTSDEEMAPHIYADNKTLFYSSNGLPGMGGMDIYKTVLRNGSFSIPENLGFPINSNKEELGISLSQNGGIVLFCSDREGDRDVYSFKLHDDLKEPAIINWRGRLLDSLGNSIKARVCIMNSKDSLLTEFSYLDEFSLFLPCGEIYSLTAVAKDYGFYSEEINLRDSTKASISHKNIVLKESFVGDRAILKNVNFDFDSYNLKANSFSQLDILVSYLEINSEFFVEIGGHTDSVGSKEYNYNLSLRRAKVIFDYLISKGIPKSRLIYKGYGDTVPVSRNVINDAGESNRRTEIKIISK